MRAVFSLTIGLAVVAGASIASAQDLASPQVSTQQVAPVQNTGGGGEITSTYGPTDHSMVVGHLGLQYLGSSSVPALTGSFDSTGTLTVDATGTGTLQTIGVRYWLNPSLGLDVGLSLGIASTSISTNTSSADLPSFFGFGLYGALPIMVAEAKHLSIHIDPFLAIAYGSSGITTGTGMMTTSQSLSGVDLRLGGNAVAELQFGFIGLPQLGLQARLGVAFEYASASYTVTPFSSPTQTTTTSKINFATSLGSYSVTDILSGSLGVVWYFGYTPGTSR